MDRNIPVHQDGLTDQAFGQDHGNSEGYIEGQCDEACDSKAGYDENVDIEGND